MKLKKYYFTGYTGVLFLSLLLIMSCTNDIPTEQDGAGQDNQVEDGVRLNPEQLSMINISYGKIREVVLSDDVMARGKLVIPSSKKILLSPPIGGVLKKIHISEGQKVDIGTSLFSLYQPEIIDLQKDYFSTKAELEYLEKEYKRQQSLSESNINAEKEFDDIRARFKSAKAVLKALEIKISNLDIDLQGLRRGEFTETMIIRSPIKGFVTELPLGQGNYLASSDQLCTIICTDQLILELSVFEKDIQKIKKGQRLSFQLSNSGDKMYEAEIVDIGSSILYPKRTLKVLAEFKNELAGLKEGSFIAATIHTGESRFLALPETAVINEGNGDTFAYYTLDTIVDAPKTFYKLPLETANAEDDYISISLKDTLPDNALIVTEGAYYINAELKKEE